MRSIRFIAGAILATTVASLGVATAASPAQAAETTGSLYGAVRDTRGAVVADAQISVYTEVSWSDPVARATVDGAGRWHVTGLETGRYKIQIGLGGWSEWAPGQRDNSTAVTYAVGTGHGTKVNSVVTAAGVIQGKLTAADGRPAAGIKVTADNYERANYWSTTTSSTGWYELRVPPGNDYVVYYADGHFVQYAPGTADQQQARHYAVASGRTLRVNDTLLSAPALTGRLTDAAGAPVAGAQVRFRTVTGFELSTTTDADGRYRFDKISPAEVKVVFVTADERVQWAYQKLDYNEADWFTLAVGATTTVDDSLLP